MRPPRARWCWPQARYWTTGTIARAAATTAYPTDEQFDYLPGLANEARRSVAQSCLQEIARLKVVSMVLSFFSCGKHLRHLCLSPLRRWSCLR